MSRTGKYCAVVGCNNSSKKLKSWKSATCDVHGPEKQGDCACLLPFSFHYFPKKDEIKKQWIAALNRENYIPTKESVVCGVHFVDGRPTPLNPVPALQLGCQRKVVPGCCLIKQVTTQPQTKRQRTKDTEQLQKISQKMDDKRVKCCFYVHVEHPYCSPHLERKRPNSTVRNHSTQTSGGLSYNLLSADSVYFYTGLKKEIVDMLVAELSKKDIIDSCKLPAQDQILLVLMRFRYNLLLRDIGLRFGIGHSYVRFIINAWIPHLKEYLGKLVCWLPREIIKSTMPNSFKEQPKTTCVIDCTEIPLQRAYRLRARSQTYSNYKSRNTVKLLIALAPSGYIMFISPIYSGRASDKFITMDSGFLNLLSPGDEVMADRRFKIESELASIGVTLNIPVFTAGKKQWSDKDVTATRIASARIHVERAIRRIKSYRILSNVLPMKRLSSLTDTITIVAGLCNLSLH